MTDDKRSDTSSEATSAEVTSSGAASSGVKKSASRRRLPASRPSGTSRTQRTHSSRSGSSRKGARTSPSAQRRPRSAQARRRYDTFARSVTNVTEPLRRALAHSWERASEQQLRFTARRVAIVAAVVCVLTLTIAGPVRTYFSQRTQMRQLAAAEATLREQIADLQAQKAKLADPAYIAAQARERLGFVMPGEIPYQVQLPTSAASSPVSGSQAVPGGARDPWYTSLWHTIADTAHTQPSSAPTVLPSAPQPHD